MRKQHLFRVAAALCLTLASATAQATPLQLTFTNCGLQVNCGGDRTVMASFVVDGPLSAPAVPAPGNLSATSVISPLQILAGSWDSVGIQTFNSSNLIGSSFLFSNLIDADGASYSSLIMVAAINVSALRLSWNLGSYDGLGYVNCYNASCSATSPVKSFVHLEITEASPTPVDELPEPGSLLLGATAAAAALAASRRRRQPKSS